MQGEYGQKRTRTRALFSRAGIVVGIGSDPKSDYLFLFKLVDEDAESSSGTITLLRSRQSEEGPRGLSSSLNEAEEKYLEVRSQQRSRPARRIGKWQQLAPVQMRFDLPRV